MTSNLKQIINLLKQSVELLYENDFYLIEHSVHEQDLSHRIAHYFENLLNNYNWYKENSLSVDVEYNRNNFDTKRVFKDCFNCKKSNCIIHSNHFNINNYDSDCKPDIILHKRGSNNNNILAIEVKKNTNECIKDFAKLTSFTCNNSEFKYKLGIYIDLSQNAQYRYFKNGQEVAENGL